MTITVAPIVTARRRSRVSPRERLQNLLPKLVLAPSFVLVLIFVYGFNLWTLFLSFTNSKAFPSTKLVGLANYQKLWTWTFETDPPSSWYTALVNMGIFGGLYVFFCLVLGLMLAILLDQKIRAEGILRPIYLYPLALSFIVTGTAWKLFLDPGIGLEKAVHVWGWTSFKFDWVVNPRMMIYCVAIAGIWQTSGFVMAMFLAGLRGVDGEIIKAAQIDGASAFATYRRIIIPIMRPVFLSAMIILTHMAIKSYDLVLSVTGKNPGGAAELPSTFMYSYTFTRNQMAVGSTSAVIMLMTIAAIMIPYLYSELREKAR
jgi:glucose/mannose transport system permease protein